HRPLEPRIAILRVVPPAPFVVSKPLPYRLVPLLVGKVSVEHVRLEEHLRSPLIIKTTTRSFSINDSMYFIFPHPDARTQLRQVDVIDALCLALKTVKVCHGSPRQFQASRSSGEALQTPDKAKTRALHYENARLGV